MLETVRKLFNDFNKNNLIDFSNEIIYSDQLTAMWHPLGFVIARLVSDGEFSYRLHIWPQEKRKPKYPEWPIHNHVFKLESLVLKGSIGSQRVIISEEADKIFSGQLYRVDYVSGGSNIINSGERVSVEKQKMNWAKAGQIYKVERGEFHQSFVEIGQFAASLVRTSYLAPNKSPTVVGESGFLDKYFYNQAALDKAEFSNLVNQLKC